MVDLSEALPLSKESFGEGVAPGALAIGLRPVFSAIYGWMGEERVLAGGEEFIKWLARGLETLGGLLYRDSKRHPYWDIFFTSAGMAAAEELRNVLERHGEKLTRARELEVRTNVERILRERASEATPRPTVAWVVNYTKNRQRKSRWFYDRSCTSKATFCKENGTANRPLVAFPKSVADCRSEHLEQCPCCEMKDRYWDLIEREATATSVDEKIAALEARLKKGVGKKKSSLLTPKQKKELKSKADDLAGTVRDIGTRFEKILAPFKNLGNGPTGS